jgi:hypothetical protein
VLIFMHPLQLGSPTGVPELDRRFAGNGRLNNVIGNPLETTIIYRRDPERVRRYATADVNEVAAVARMLGGAAFALAQIAPRRYERLADAGAATGVIDPLLVRAYLRAGMALPAHTPAWGRDTSYWRCSTPLCGGSSTPRRESGCRKSIPIVDAGVPDRPISRPSWSAACPGGSARRAAACRKGKRARCPAGIG